MVALLPFNYLNARMEQARLEMENASAKLEMVLLRGEKNAANGALIA
jgi:biopolymer transport protein ExbB